MKTFFRSSRREEAHFKMFHARPHPDPLPQGEETAIVRFDFCGKLSGESSRTIFFGTANVSPSPWGEGRGEGGRCN
jgi:hypothetical protein